MTLRQFRQYRGWQAWTGLFIGWLVLTGAAANEAGPSAIALLEGMSRANRSMNYRGVFVYQRGSQIDAMRIVHRGDGDIEFERLISLTGAAREVIREGDQVTCVFPDEKSVIVERSAKQQFRMLSFSQPLSELETHYRFSIRGDERVAGRATWITTIEPRDGNRYGYQASIDKETNLPLRSMVLDRDGNLLEQTQFTELEVLDSVPENLLKTEINSENYTWYTNTKQAKAKAEFLAPGSWQPGWIPPGFKMLENRHQMMTATPMPVNHSVYSDGLSVVSIFVERVAEGKQAMKGVSSMGAVNAISRVVDDIQVTVVGEVPLATAQQIADSVTISE
ncbi:MAG: MucB/RseB C-terminal domain-containing protein [Gammaproteobacteria bacterium]|nr:MucB/RseB C-terminal domain-containing protein [Gammaproteobacteria bacterium]